MGVMAGMVLLGVAVVGWWPDEPLPEGVTRDQFEMAQRRFAQLQGRQPARTDTLMLLAESFAAEGEYLTATRCYREIADDHPLYGAPARFQEAEAFLRLDLVDAGEASFRRFLALQSAAGDARLEQTLKAYEWLTYLMSVQLRFEERQQLLKDQQQLAPLNLEDANLFYFPTLLIWNTPAGWEALRKFAAADPDSLTLRIAAARYLTVNGQVDEAFETLVDLHSRHPADDRCRAALLECCFERGNWSDFSRYVRELSPAKPTEPWLLTLMRGHFAIHEQRWRDAQRHFQQLLKSDPANVTATIGLGKACLNLGDSAGQEQAARNSLLLGAIRVALARAVTGDIDAIRKVAAMSEELGFHAASAAYRAHAARLQAAHTQTQTASPAPSNLQTSPASAPEAR